MNFARNATNSRLFLAILFRFLAVVGSKSVAVGDLLVAPSPAGLVDDVAGSIRTVNPNFKKLPGFDENCVQCAIATEKRFRGIQAAAEATDGPLPINLITKEFGGRFQPVSGASEIGSILSQSGSGSRGIVLGLGPKSNHVFNVRFDKGVVRFLDSQSGGLGVKNFNEFRTFKFLQTAKGKR